MRKALWLTLVAALLGLLAFAPVDAAGLSQDPTTSAIPHITAITDGALCPVQAVTTVPPPASALGPPVTNGK